MCPVCRSGIGCASVVSAEIRGVRTISRYCARANDVIDDTFPCLLNARCACATSWSLSHGESAGRDNRNCNRRSLLRTEGSGFSLWSTHLSHRLGTMGMSKRTGERRFGGSGPSAWLEHVSAASDGFGALPDGDQCRDRAVLHHFAGAWRSDRMPEFRQQAVQAGGSARNVVIALPKAAPLTQRIPSLTQASLTERGSRACAKIVTVDDVGQDSRTKPKYETFPRWISRNGPTPNGSGTSLAARLRPR